MSLAIHDEYQDGVSAGSLARARGCWHDLMMSQALPLPQRFTYAFRCPGQREALGLIDFLRHTEYAAFLQTTSRAGLPAGDPWQVVGTTRAFVWSLPSLEHLFMRMRRAGPRFESALVTLDLVPMVGRVG